MKISKDIGETILACSDVVHQTIWDRFMSPDYIIYDYVGLDGEVILPTPEECEQNKPNGLGYWTPIENAGFFNGIYLLSQINQYNRHKTSEKSCEIRKLVSGLYKAQDVCNVPGMISRGVGSDGQCHYAASSNDQNLPWIIGLWKYLSTDIPSPAEKADCRNRLINHIKALQQNNWVIPGESKGFDTANMLADQGLEGNLSSVHLLITAKIYSELIDDPEHKLYYHFLTEKLKEGNTRLDIISQGFTESLCTYAWIVAICQYSIRELFRTESKPDVKKIYQQYLNTTAKGAVEAISRYQLYSDEPKVFTPDWRIMLKHWKPHDNYPDAWIIAEPQLKQWGVACPAIRAEKSTMLVSVPATWIVMMSGNNELINQQLPEIVKAITRFDYRKAYYAGIFFVENLVEELALQL